MRGVPGDPATWVLEPGLIAWMFVMLFLVGLADSTLGMGYGTLGVPLLVGLGFSPHMVVPAMILGQMAEGSHTTFWHTRLGNVKWGKKKGEVRSREETVSAYQVPKEQAGFLGWKNWTTDTTALVILSVGGVATAITGAVTGALLPARILTLYIAYMVIAIGLIVIIKSWRPWRFSWKGLWALGAIAAFNRGIGGGGYGPITTGGQIITGRNVRGAIGSTTLAEVFISAVALITWLIMIRVIWWEFFLIVFLLSATSSPCSALLVRKFGEKRLDLVIGAACLLIGTRALLRAYGIWTPI